MTREAAAHYLAAMIDGEGCVYVGGRAGHKKCVQIANTEWELIEATIDACESDKLALQREILAAIDDPDKLAAIAEREGIDPELWRYWLGLMHEDDGASVAPREPSEAEALEGTL